MLVAGLLITPSGEVQVANGGAVLPNIDDDSRRCPPTPACHDGTDTVVNGPADAEDLTIVRVPARVPVEVIGAAAGHTNVFARRKGEWHLVRPGEVVGGTLGVEATDVVGSGWDGRIGLRAGARMVHLRVAPLRTHHHLQRAQQVLVSNDLHVPADGDGIVGELLRLRRAAKPGFLDDLRRASPVPVRHLELSDIWTQDVVEPAYVEAGAKRMRVLIRTPLANTAEHEKALYGLRGPGVAVVRTNAARGTSVDAGGNIETIPPYPGRPHGRVIMGSRPGELPNAELLAMLDDPLLVDTSWLANAHIDEFVQFLPAPDGWRIAVADPRAGLALLRGLPDDTPLVHGFQAGEPIFVDWQRLEFVRESPTVAQTLAKVSAVNMAAAAKIEETLGVLLRETGVRDVVRVPALFEHIPALDQTIAKPGAGGLLPTAVNGVVLDQRRYLAPDPHGPLLGGRDVFRDAVVAAYGKRGSR